MRFVGLALEDRVPDAETIGLFGERLTRASAVEDLFARFDATRGTPAISPRACRAWTRPRLRCAGQG